jgi:hypothetical protein
MTKTFAFSSRDGAFLGHVDNEMDMLSALPDPSTVKPQRLGPHGQPHWRTFGSRRRCWRCGRTPAPNNVDYLPYCDNCLPKIWHDIDASSRSPSAGT